MLSSHRISNSVTINYNYTVSSDQLPVSKTASASVSQFVTPSLTVCKTASTESTVLCKSFYYEITLTNLSSYPIYVYIYDHIPKGVCYDPFSFTQDNMPLSYINLVNWVNLGKLPSNSSTSLRFKARLATDLKIKEFSNQACVRYCQEPSDNEPIIWHRTKSNRCIIKINDSKKS